MLSPSLVLRINSAKHLALEDDAGDARGQTLRFAQGDNIRQRTKRLGMRKAPSSASSAISPIETAESTPGSAIGRFCP